MRVPTDELASLPRVLRRAADSPENLSQMQAELRCLWRSLFWTSMQGSCFGEPARGDAFDTMMAVLRRRIKDRAMPVSAVPTGALRSACEVGKPLPLHLVRRP